MESTVNGTNHKIRNLILFGLLISLQLTLASPLCAQDQQPAPTKSPIWASAYAFLGSAGVISSAFIIDNYNDNPVVKTFLLSGGVILGPVLGYAYLNHPEIGMKYAGTRALILGTTVGSSYLIWPPRRL